MRNKIYKIVRRYEVLDYREEPNPQTITHYAEEEDALKDFKIHHENTEYLGVWVTLYEKDFPTTKEELVNLLNKARPKWKELEWGEVVSIKNRRASKIDNGEIETESRW